jgi:hypothetical protein
MSVKQVCQPNHCKSFYLKQLQQRNDGMLSVAYGNAAMVAVVELAKEVRKLKEELRALKSE